MTMVVEFRVFFSMPCESKVVIHVPVQEEKAGGHREGASCKKDARCILTRCGGILLPIDMCCSGRREMFADGSWLNTGMDVERS